MHNVQAKVGSVTNILKDATATGVGPVQYKDSTFSTYQAIVTGTGALTCNVDIQVSNDGVNFCSTAMGTIALSGTTSVTDGFATQSNWKYVRASVTTLTGTGATVNVYQGG